ncbi:MAG: sugar-transfer associated ATP-grasp domain-containing protein [Pseudomonadota bacterium]
MEDAKPLQLETHLKLRRDLSTVQPSSLTDIWSAAPAGRKIETCWKFLQARYGTGKLSSGEFLQFGFCDPTNADRDITTFAGKQAQQAFNKIYNDKTWYALTKNKIAFEMLMRGGGMPCPQTIAIYDRKGRGAGAPVLKTTNALEAFLLSEDQYPFFCKPTTGLLSIGSFRIDARRENTLIVNATHEYPVAEVIRYIQGLSPKGYIFQSVLEPHEGFKDINCTVISSLRFLVLNHEKHAKIHSGVLKVPAQGEVADNFWRTGSVIGAIDIDSGKLKRAVLKSDTGVTELKKNDPQAKTLFDFTLPDFEKAKDCVLKGARFMPGVRVQSWDVAITTKGPILLEVNFGGDLNLWQLSSNTGVMDKDYCEILREAGFKGRLPH